MQVLWNPDFVIHIFILNSYSDCDIYSYTDSRQPSIPIVFERVANLNIPKKPLTLPDRGSHFIITGSHSCLKLAPPGPHLVGLRHVDSSDPFEY